MSKHLIIRRIEPSEVDLLRVLGESTFRETFEAQNSKENLDAYLAKSFSLANVQAQLDASTSEFYFATVDGEGTWLLEAEHI